ncbi:hypothetical protein KI387_040606, partial [Taxus chinensis]
MHETRGSGVSGEIGRGCTNAFGTKGTKRCEVRDSDVSAGIGTEGPFGLRTFGTKSSE